MGRARRYEAENGQIVSTLGKRRYSTADGERLLGDMRKLHDEDLARGDYRAAESMYRLMGDLADAIRSAGFQTLAQLPRVA